MDTHKCLSCGETMTEEQSKKHCPFCYTKKGIVRRNPNDVGENHQEKAMAYKPQSKKSDASKKKAEKPVKPDAPVPKPEKKAEKQPAPVVTPVEKPVEQPKPVEGVKVGKKKSIKEYAESVRAQQAATKPPVAQTDTVTLIAKKEASLAAFTKNGAPKEEDASDPDLYQHQLTSYNEYVAKLKADIAALKEAPVSKSAAESVVKFGKDGVARKLTPEEGKKALNTAVKKPATSDKKPQNTGAYCICLGCINAPLPDSCETCGGNVKKCLVKGVAKCDPKEKNGRSVCIQSMIDRKFEPEFIANAKLSWGIA